MYVPFAEMPDSSRIWIYQSSRELNENEVNEIKELARGFVNSWTAHKQTLYASFEILNHIFLIVAIDENANDASGCSIDKSVQFIMQLEKQFRISLLDRFNVAFRLNEKVFVKSLDDFLKMYEEKKMSDDLIFFNNLIYTKNALKNKWEIPIRESWVAQRLK